MIMIPTLIKMEMRCDAGCGGYINQSDVDDGDCEGNDAGMNNDANVIIIDE